MRYINILPVLLALSGASCASPTDGPANTLHYGSPQSVGLLPEPLEEMVKNVSSYSKSANYSGYTYEAIHPIQPGGAVVVGHDSTIVSSFAWGYTNLYADSNGTFLPKSEQRYANNDTIWDLASLTKVVTAVAALRLIDSGQLDYKRTVASYMPEFATNGKENVTVLNLFTHTSGFPPDPEPGLYYPNITSIEQRKNIIITYPLQSPPDTVYTYSDLNFMNMRYLLETITGQEFQDIIGSLTSALGMHNTFFNVGNIEGAKFPYYYRMAPTEYQIEVLGPLEPQRPQPVQGTVHDENAWSLNGVSGHAGLFSTAGDIAILCQMILNNGTYGDVRILHPETVDLMFTNFNQKFPGDEHSLGFELDQYYFSGPMASMLTGGHTGFTGTTITVDRGSNSFFVTMGHRVHPSRLWSSNNIVREAVGYWVAESLGRNVTFPPL
jgi:CubicO group peptidase (beta-lactamase class C family)